MQQCRKFIAIAVSAHAPPPDLAELSLQLTPLAAGRLGQALRSLSEERLSTATVT